MKKNCKNRGHLVERVKIGLRNYYHIDWTVSKILLTRQKSKFNTVPTNCDKVSNNVKLEQKHRDKDRNTTFKIIFIHKHFSY